MSRWFAQTVQNAKSQSVSRAWQLEDQRNTSSEVTYAAEDDVQKCLVTRRSQELMGKSSRLTNSCEVTARAILAGTAVTFDWYSSADLVPTWRDLPQGTSYLGNPAIQPKRDLARHWLVLCIAAARGLLGIALDAFLLSIFISCAQQSLHQREGVYAGRLTFPIH